MLFGHFCFLAGRTPLPSQSSDNDSCHLRMALICDFRLPFVWDQSTLHIHRMRY